MTAKILVVDDEPSVRALVRDILELDDYEVFEAKDGDEALERFRADHYDTVILDIMMPGISGLDVLREIRAGTDHPEGYTGSTSDTPVILLTAASDDDTTWEGWTSGASVFIAKPFDPSNLLEWLDRTVNRRLEQHFGPAEDEDLEGSGDLSAEFRGLSE